MKEKHAHLDPLHLVVVASPYVKWVFDFMTCHLVSTMGHTYIIVVLDYFTKWVEAMPTFSNNCKMTSLFMFNHIIE